MKTKERYISVSGMLLYALKAWRSIAAAALAAAVMFSLASFTGGVKTVTQEDYDAVQDFIEKEERYETLHIIQSNLVMNRMTPTKAYTARISYGIKYNGSAASVLMNYINFLNSEEWDQRLVSEIPELECKYPQEIFDAEIKGNYLNVEIYYPEEEVLHKITDLLNKTIFEKAAEKSDEYEISLEAFKIEGVISDSLAKKKQAIIDEFFKADEEAAAALARMNDLQISLYDKIKAGETDIEKMQLPYAVNVRLVIVAMLASAFLMSLFHMLRYLMPDAVRLSDDPDKILGIHSLGTIENQNEKAQKLFSKLDHWIALERAKQVKGLTEMQQKERICSNILFYAKEQNIAHICIIDPSKETRQLSQRLLTMLDGKIDVVVVKNLFARPADKSEGYVLLACSDKTSLEMLKNSVNFCNGQNRAIIGLVTEI